MKKEVLVFIFDGYADWELGYVLPEVNASGKYIVKTVSQNKKAKISMGGLTVKPDYTLADMPKKPAMFILPGGKGWLDGKHGDAEKAVSYFMKKDVPVAAICDGVTFLAKNGFLDNIEHTGNTAEYLQKSAKEYKGKKKYIKSQAVTAGNLITANGTSSLEFAVEILLKLKIIDEDKANIWYSFFKKGYYKK